MLLKFFILLLAIPAGFLIAYWANDELIAGRKWFKCIMASSIILGICFVFFGNLPVALSLGFVFIVTGISYWKGFDKNWVKRKV